MVELICYYTANSLKQSFSGREQSEVDIRTLINISLILFSGLDMTLKFPFRDLSLVKAGFDFTPEKNDSNMLMFRSGDVS